MTMRRNRFTQDGKALVSKGCSEGNLRQDIGRAVAALGGFDRFVEPGNRILLKPNYNTADPPPASSDPEFVRAVIELLYEHGAGQVIVGESSKIGDNTRDNLRRAGLLQVATAAGAEVIVFDEDGWARVQVGGRDLRRVALARAALAADRIVYTCCLKTHQYADLTVSLKLAMGFVRPRDRIGMHLWRLREKLADLNLAIGPDLALVDARRCFISGGPMAGDVRTPGLILASGDRVALDVEAAKIIQSYPGHSLGEDPWALPMIRRAVALGLGAAVEEDYRVVGWTGQ
jgi:uncharacterized protein (DUF362 family)